RHGSPADYGPPGFADLRVVVENPGTQVRVVDGRTGAECWSAPLPGLPPGAGAGAGVAALLRDPTGHPVAADPGPGGGGVGLGRRRVRWAHASLGAAGPPRGAAAGWVRVMLRVPDPPAAPVINLVVPAGPGPTGVLLQWQNRLASVDPASGAVRWIRND